MDFPVIDRNSRVTLYPLRVRLEGDEAIVGRVESGEFILLPAVGATVIEALGAALPLGEVEDRLGQEGLVLDLSAFVTQLAAEGFVAAVDGEPLGPDPAEPPNLPWLRAEHVGWLFSRPMIAGWLALLAAALVALFRQPELFPNYRDAFWSSRPSLVLFVNTALAITVLIVHELMHLCAARSVGVPARINFGTRLTWLVLQTDVSGVWAVERAQRFRVYLAGMAWDSSVLALALVGQAFFDLPLALDSFLAVLAVVVFVGLLFQFEFFMRTDIFFIVQDLLRCRNLFGDSMAFLRYGAASCWLVFTRGDRSKLENPLDQIPEVEVPKVRVYAVIVLLGSTIALSSVAFYGLPILVKLFFDAVASLLSGLATGNALLIFDGAITLAIEGTLQVLFVRTFLRTKRHWFEVFARWRAGRLGPQEATT